KAAPPSAAMTRSPTARTRPASRRFRTASSTSRTKAPPRTPRSTGCHGACVMRLRPPAGDDLLVLDDRAGHRIAVGAEQEHRQARHVLGHDQAPEGLLAPHFVKEIR